MKIKNNLTKNYINTLKKYKWFYILLIPLYFAVSIIICTYSVLCTPVPQEKILYFYALSILVLFILAIVVEILSLIFTFICCMHEEKNIRKKTIQIFKKV